jgi:hypothetical protein
MTFWQYASLHPVMSAVALVVFPLTLNGLWLITCATVCGLVRGKFVNRLGG